MRLLVKKRNLEGRPSRLRPYSGFGRTKKRGKGMVKETLVKEVFSEHGFRSKVSDEDLFWVMSHLEFRGLNSRGVLKKTKNQRQIF